jgi:hypothetical protein
MKFRIIEKKYSDGKSYYFVQHSKFLWWGKYTGKCFHFIAELYHNRGGSHSYNYIEFDSLEKAEEAIRKVRASIIALKFKKKSKVIHL